jgi:magnesium transporter
MINFYNTTNNAIHKVEQLEKGTWVDIVNPTSEERMTISSFGLPMDFITYPLDLDEQAHFEREEGDITFILVRIPIYQGKEEDVPYTTIPLSIILTPENIFTICTKSYGPLQDFANNKVRLVTTKKPKRFLLQLLMRITANFLFQLREINKAVDLVEDQLEKSMRNKEVLELLKLQKSLVYFTTALKSNEILLERLQRHHLFRQYPEDVDLLEDVIIENQEAIQISDISTTILSSMMDAFASIISNNLNSVMKFLASITIVLSIPTIVASFFGMNVGLPFAAHSAAFWLILGISVAISFVIVLIFMKREWF